MKLGRFELHAVSDGFFRLDGGAMFGIVPKVVWEKVTRVDEQNRIYLSLTTLLVRTGSANVLVDTGIGSKHDPKFVSNYAVDRFTTVADGLRKLGLGVEDIDHVVLSHLHFDHAGGATVRKNGELVPQFPRAKYVIQRGMWEEAQDPNPRTKGSYLPDDFLPLEKHGAVRFVDGDAEVVPGVRVSVSGGHVKHHQIVYVESEGRTAVYWADLLPTTNHVKPAWVMGYDLYPHEVASLKVKLLERAVREEWVNVFEHDPRTAMGRIRSEGKNLVVEPLVAAERPAGWE